MTWCFVNKELPLFWLMTNTSLCPSLSMQLPMSHQLGCGIYPHNDFVSDNDSVELERVAIYTQIYIQNLAFYLSLSHESILISTKPNNYKTTKRPVTHHAPKNYAQFDLCTLDGIYEYRDILSGRWLSENGYWWPFYETKSHISNQRGRLVYSTAQQIRECFCQSSTHENGF